MENNGVIYYNRGLKMIVRLAVSIHSLRKHYKGRFTILSQGDDCKDVCQEIAAYYGGRCQHVDFKTTPGERDTYLNACLSHEKTPYDISVWLDSDTVVLREFNELFSAAEKNEFAIAQFSTWKSSGGKIRGRIKSWESLYPDWVQPAIDYGPAINCGVFAFRKDSKLMADWWNLAEPGRHLSWIPDETCCQLILHRYPHIIMPQEYNTSCKYGKREGARIIHYHGRKHCRILNDKPINMSDLWWKEYEEIKNLPFVKKYVDRDRMLKKNMPLWKGIK